MAVSNGRMRFTYDDADGEKAFARRRDELGEAFADWLRTHDVPGDPNDAGLLMDWKFGYADGALDTWTVPDVGEFLLGWCPRKLSAAPQDCAEIPRSVAAFVEFLAHAGLLGPGSQAPAQIRRYCERTSAGFVREMGNPANFGMAKSLFGGVGGLEPDADPESIAELMARLQDLPPDAVEAALENLDPADFAGLASLEDLDDEPPIVGPVRLPSLEQRLAAVRAAPDMRRLRLLARWCPAPGRLLTAKGNLRLADARHLVELLDTGDDVELDGRRAVVSAIDLPHLTDLIDTAVDAGAVRRQKGRLVAVARFAELDEIAAHEKVVRAAIVDRPPTGSLAPLVAALAPLMAGPGGYVGPLLAELLAAGDECVEVDELVEAALGTADAGPARADLILGTAVDRIERTLHRLAGLAVITMTSGEPCLECDDRHPLAALTAAGVPIAVDLARAAGFEVVLRPDPATASADDVADLLGLVEPAEWERDASIWFAARDDPAAAALALVAAITAADQDLVVAAGGLLSVDVVLGEHAVDAVRAQLGGPHDGIVVRWLLARSALDRASIDPLRLVSGLVDVLASALDREGPSEMLACLGESGPDEQAAVLSEIWRLDHPRLAEVLDAIGAHHRVKAVAKAARRALMKYRSRIASR